LLSTRSSDGRPRYPPAVPAGRGSAPWTNRDFAAAVNQGTRQRCRGRRVRLLAEQRYGRERGAGHASRGLARPRRDPHPLITYFDHPEIVWSAGAGLNPLTLEIRSNTLGSIDRGQWREVTDRQHATACASLLPRSTLEQVGLLDERFFYYYDDADYSLRVIRAGLRILFVPQAKVLHKVALASGGVDTPYHRYWMGRSSVLYFRKHVRGWRWAIVAPYRLASALRTTARLLLQRKPSTAAAYLRGLRDGLRNDLPPPTATDSSA
jgi:GT2 family glycosyltransferase